MQRILLLIGCLLNIASFTEAKTKDIKHFPAWKSDFEELKKISPVLALFMEHSQKSLTLEQLEKKMHKALKQKKLTTLVNIDRDCVPHRFIQDPIVTQIKHWNSATTVIRIHILNVLSAPKVQAHIQQCATCKHLKTMVEKHCSTLNKGKEKVTSQDFEMENLKR